MDKNINKILEKIEFPSSKFHFFNGVRFLKVRVFPEDSRWNIFLSSDNLLDVEVIKEFNLKINSLDNNVKNIEVFWDIKNIKDDDYINYFPLLLDVLKFKVKDIVLNRLFFEDGNLYFKVNNKREEDKYSDLINKINLLYKQYGFIKEVNIKLIKDGDILNNIKKDLEVSLDIEVNKKKEIENNIINKHDDSIILGKNIKGSPIKINTILGEDNNIVVIGKIFGVEFFEPSNSDFKIITLKITDYTDSIFCKIFVRDNKEFIRLSKILKSGIWIKVSGYTKDDLYAKELVLFARDIVKEDVIENVREDNALEKRVELHTHTRMSQMDGIVDEVEVVKQAIKWGHKGIAITDHNGVQAFPKVFNFVKWHNKALGDGEEPFKVIYGLELTMIDDKVNIVIRPSDKIMLNEEFVVFDFETTGFNAAAGDSIIEIGAVKLRNGEILERYDELINPGKELPKKIVEITNITDDMLKDKATEEEAVKRFVEWVGDLPMVAHNATFDCSFLEMAYKKYNLGEFKNPVIDTLELSRTMDSGYSRHSLAVLAKRYDILKSEKNPNGFWDESLHHRGDYDAEGTALIFHKMMKKLEGLNIEKMTDLDKLVDKDEIHRFGRQNHVNILVKNKEGLKNLFKIVSLSSTSYLFKTPRIPRSVLEEHRDGLLIGSGCYESEVFKEAKSKSDDELSNIIRFYDYVEVQPLDVYCHLVDNGEFPSFDEVKNNIEKIIRVVKDSGKIIVATGDVHTLNSDDKIYREIIINQKVPGGGRHPLARNNIKNIPNQYFRTTEEMLDDFSFLGEELSKEIVIDNTNLILNMCDIVEVVIDTKGIPFSPRVKNDKGVYLDCAKEVTDLVYNRAKELYGDILPTLIEERIALELYGDSVLKTINESTSNEEEAFKILHETLLAGFAEVKKLLTDSLIKKGVETSEVENNVKKTLGGIIGGGFDSIYLISQMLVKHSNDEGYIVGSRGSVGSSFVATLMGITEVNPLAAHYRCGKCKYSIFEDENGVSLGSVYSSGFDLPDKSCPNCNIKMIKDGQDMPFATFLGFNADKVPDIDLNFSDLNQASAHAYTKVLFGENNVFKAGTVGTVAEKTAYGFVKGYLEDNEIDNMRSVEIERLAMGITGVKRTTGQHPGGIIVIPDYMEVSDFTPFQYPADDNNALWRTTHFDYHSIEECLLKLDILGHSDPTQLRLIHLQSNTDVLKVPLDDKDTMSIFTSVEKLGVTNEEIMCPTGTLGIPEFGTPFTIKMVEETKPTTFGELVKISGLSHGTDVWVGNAQELIKNNIVPFSEVIGCRDDIMVYLMYNGVEPLSAFKIMEFVRKGRASKDPEGWAKFKEIMEKAKVPSWFIDSCQKIKYMFPKAHAAAYVISAFRIAWYKVHMPVYFYSSWFSTKAVDVDVESMILGYDIIKRMLEDILAKGFEASNKENGMAESLKVALEASARGIKFLPIDLYKSEASIWVVNSDNEIIPPFSAIAGLGDTVAKNIVAQRKISKFLSKEDLQSRAKVSGTLLDKMNEMNILKDLPDSNQLSLF